nr:hypothetical protein [Tanacetum cinerariifolium]
MSLLGLLGSEELQEIKIPSIRKAQEGAKEGPNYAFMAYTSSCSDSKSSEEETKAVRKNNDVSIIEEWVLDDEEMNPTRFGGVTDWYLEPRFIENQSILGNDAELSDKGSPRVIVYGYYGLPMLPVAPPSPDYIPGPEEPHTPPAPQDEDKHEPMFIHPHDHDFVPEPIYPEYIPL